MPPCMRPDSNLRWSDRLTRRSRRLGWYCFSSQNLIENIQKSAPIQSPETTPRISTSLPFAITRSQPTCLMIARLRLLVVSGDEIVYDGEIAGKRVRVTEFSERHSAKHHLLGGTCEKDREVTKLSVKYHGPKPDHTALGQNS